VKDGLIADPDRCTFDPAVLQCTGSTSGACLMPGQVRTAQLTYSSPKNPKTGRPITGLARGSELGWTDLGWTASARATGLDHFRFLVFRNPAWSFRESDFLSDVVAAEAADGGTLNALDVDVRPFIGRGGKL